MIVTAANRRLATRSRSAFTLLEVLVVVAILVVLAGVASISILRYLDDAKKDKARLDIRAIEQASKAYYTKSGGNWPENLGLLIQPPDGGRPFLENGLAAITDPWGNTYTYDPASGNGEKPLIGTTAPDGQVITNLQ